MIDIARLHQPLLGQSGARNQFNTPVLVIELEAFERNLTAMATFARSKGVALRPHAKTHKCIDIARRQMAAGAVGVCCAKLGEAEALALGGIESILITSPVVSTPAIERLIQLNRRIKDLAVVVDHPDNVDALASAAGSDPLTVLIDIDPGIRRTGVSSPDRAVRLLERIRSRRNLDYRGVQMYCGVQQHIQGYQDRAAAIVDRMNYLRQVIDLLTRHGGRPDVITGAGTGTHHIDADQSLYTEWQVGSYIFMDRQYAECDLGTTFEHSLFIDARVVSANTPGMATIDAGFKAMSTDAGAPLVVSGAPNATVYRFMGDEHGAVVDPASAHRWQIGELVRLTAPHCDPTVNLYDTYHVMKGDTLVALWEVSARGRSY